MRFSLTFPGGRKKALTFSFDGGFVQDIRLIETLNKYNLKATFNISSGLMTRDDKENNINSRLTLKQVRKLFLDSQHEVACHGYTHNRMDYPPYIYGLREAIKDREALEDILERPIRGMAYPYGKFSNKLIDDLKTAGVVYGRTKTETGKFNIPLSADDWMRFNPTCRYNDYSVFKYVDEFINATAKDLPLLLSIWGQSSNFDWEMFRTFCEAVGERDEIWYTTVIKLYDYFDAYNHLLCNATFTRIHNPSAIAVWISTSNHNILKVNPGQTVEI